MRHILVSRLPALRAQNTVHTLSRLPCHIMSIQKRAMQSIDLLEAQDIQSDLRTDAESLCARLKIWAFSIGAFAQPDRANEFPHDEEVAEILMLLLDRLIEVLPQSLSAPAFEEGDSKTLNRSDSVSKAW